MSKALNLVESYVSNVGNSFVAGLLVEYYRQQEYPYQLYDLDKLNPDLWQRYRQLGNARCDVFALSDIIDAIDLDDREAIVNVPTGDYGTIADTLDRLNATELFDHIPLRRWFVSTGDPKSWQIFTRLVETDLNCETIFVHNLLAGVELTEAQYEYFEDSGIALATLSRIDFNSVDLELLQSSPDRPLFALNSSLTAAGSRRLMAFSQAFFAELDPILKGG